MHEIARLAHVTLRTPLRDETVEVFTRYPAGARPPRRSLVTARAGADVRGTSERQGPSRSDRLGACGTTRTHNDARRYT
jgi:hypothetical protein